MGLIAQAFGGGYVLVVLIILAILAARFSQALPEAKDMAKVQNGNLQDTWYPFRDYCNIKMGEALY